MAEKSRAEIDANLDVNIVSGASVPITGDLLNEALKEITESYYNKADDVIEDPKYSVFCIWAEENADLTTGASNEWSFGNGDPIAGDDGIVIPIDCELFAMGLDLVGGNATVRSVIDANNNLEDYQVTVTSTSLAYETFAEPLQINAGSALRFRTISSSGTNTNGGRVVAFFRVAVTSEESSTLSDLLDVSRLSPTTNELLVYNGSNWASATFDYSTLINVPTIVGADGSIDTHNDVDISSVTPDVGDVLVWDGTHFVPKKNTKGYTVFTIWAEEATDLTTGQSQEWAFGNGDDTTVSNGIVVPIACELFAMGLNVEGGDATVQIVVNDNIALSSYQVSANAPSDYASFENVLNINAGDVINFRTISSSGGSTESARVSAFFRMAASTENDSIVSDLLDVSISSAVVDEVLLYNGSNWVNEAFDYANVANAPSATGEVIKMNGLEVLSVNNSTATMNTTGFTSYNAKLSLTEDVALSITGMITGESGTIVLEQDASGTNIFTLPSNSKVAGGTGLTITPAANEKMILTYFYDGQDFNWSSGSGYA